MAKVLVTFTTKQMLVLNDVIMNLHINTVVDRISIHLYQKKKKKSKNRLKGEHAHFPQ